MHMHRKSRGYKIYPENSEKWIEDAVLHNPLPHLYNLQGESLLKICAQPHLTVGFAISLNPNEPHRMVHDIKPHRTAQ